MKYILFVVLVVVVGCTKKTSQITVVEPLVKYIEERENPPEIIPEDIPISIVPDQEALPVYDHIEKVVYFDFDSDELSTGVIQKLNVISATIRPNTELVITGGCCPVGRWAYNYRLGLRRAVSVYNFLEPYCGGGINMVAASYGEDNLVTNDPHEYYLNRRVVINIKEKREK